MKKLFIILFLLPVIAFGQTDSIIDMQGAEYNNQILGASGRVYGVVWGGYVGVNRDTTASYGVSNIAQLGGGWHSGIVRSSTGGIYLIFKDVANGSRPGFTAVTTDASGNSFTGNTDCYGWMDGWLTIKNDSVYTWGIDQLKINGGSAIASPTRLPQPAGKQIVKLQPLEPSSSLDNNILLAQTLDNQIWIYPKNASGVPFFKFTPSSPITAIGGIGQGAYVVATTTDILAWGPLSKMVGLASNPTTPTSILSAFTSVGLQLPVKEIASDWNCMFVLDSAGNLFSIGDAVHGGTATGVEISDWRHHYYGATAAQWSWNFGVLEIPQTAPIKIPGKFIHIRTCIGQSFHAYACDMKGGWSSCGRNKAGALFNGEEASNSDVLPEWANVPQLTKVNPLQQVWPSGGGSAFDSTATIAPRVSAGINQYITTDTSTLYGMASQQAGTITTWAWTKLSGAGVIVSPSSPFTKTTGLSGRSVFKLTVTSSNGLIKSDTVAVLAQLTPANNCNCSYYFAASGADGNAGTSGSPFQTLTKLNSLASDTTASFYLNRGDVFTGAITNFSGKTLDAYGTGARPVVSGFVTLSGWSSLGGGIYSASCAGCKVTDNILTMDGVQQPLARYPNTGYLTYESFSGTTSITDNQLTGSPNWTGGYVAIRNNQYTLSTNLITNHSGTTLTYTSASSLPGTNNFGYFITNHPSALDTLGEWVVSSGTIHMYFGAATPSSYTIKTTIADTLLGLADGLKAVTINNVDFEGAGIYGVYIGQDTNTVIQNCTFNWMGSTAILDNKGQYSRLINNNIRNANDNGIFTAGTADHTYTGYDTVAQCGMMPGQGKLWQTHNYMGIATTSHRSIVEYCRVDTTGYNNYYCYNYDRISHNWGNASCNFIQDGAAIYLLGYTDTTETKHIDSNVLVHGIGAVAGTNASNKFVNGVYVDQNNANVFVGGNTVWDMPNGGIFIHNTRRSSITDNTVYGCTYQILFQGDTWTYPINNMTVKRNKLGVSGPNQYMYRFDQFNGLHFNNSLGLIDSNYYGYYTNTVIGFMNSITNQTYKQWQDSTAETHGRILAAPLLFQVNGTSVPVAVGLSNTYVDAFNTPFYTSASIPAFGGLLLFQGNYFRIRKNIKIRFQ